MNDERFNLGAAKLRIKLQEYFELGYHQAAEERFCTLIRIMFDSGRMDELLNALDDQDRIKSLYHEHRI